MLIFNNFMYNMNKLPEKKLKLKTIVQIIATIYLQKYFDSQKDSLNIQTKTQAGSAFTGLSNYYYYYHHYYFHSFHESGFLSHI